MVKGTQHRWGEGYSTGWTNFLPQTRSLAFRALFTLRFTNTLTWPPASGYEVEVVKHTLDTTLMKFTLQWERRGAFTSFCYLNSLMFWVMEKVYFAYLNMKLMKLTHPGLRECGQCRFIWALCLCKWWGWGQKSPRVRAKAVSTACICFSFHFHDTVLAWEKSGRAYVKKWLTYMDAYLPNG